MQTDEQAENIMPGSGPCDGREHQNIQISLCDDLNPRLSISFKRLFAYLLRCIQTGQDSSGSVSHAAEGVSGWGGTMVSAEHEPIGSGGRAPSGVQGQSPCQSGGQGAKWANSKTASQPLSN